MEHLSVLEILAYIAGKTKGSDIYRIESHLAECLSCASRIDHFLDIRERFDEVWDELTESKGAEQAYLSHVKAALTEVSLKEAEGKRISEWLDRFIQKTGGMIGIAIDVTQKAACILEDRLGELILPQGGFQFREVPQPVRILGEGQAEPVTLESTTPIYIRKITIDPAAGRITIQAEIMKKPWPLVLLIPRAEGKARVREFRHPEAVDYLLAEFDDVRGGEYEILFETASS